MVKVSKLVQRKLIPHRSNVGSGAFRKINILKIFQDSYYVCRDLTISQSSLKPSFSCLAYSQYKTEKSSDTDFKRPMNQVDRTDPHQVIAFEVHKMS